ncbi:MAG: PAS domain-containing sensor histidine kinase [Thermodesulfobacteriota bacterium]
MARTHAPLQSRLEPGAATSLTHDRFVVDSLPIAVVTVDPDLRISGFNPWAEHLTGYAKDEVIGRPCGEVLQGERCHAQCPLRTVLDQEHRVLRLETTIRNRQGQRIPVRMNTAGLFDASGALIGGVEAFQDLSELKRAERERDNLTSMFAHDLKSSVVIIGGFARRLLAGAGDISAETARRPLEVIKKEADKLESLMNEFLEFSRLQAGQFVLNPSAISLETELAEVVEAYRLQAAQAEVEVVVPVRAELPVIQADAGRLRRVFVNLLDNALKYARPRTTVTIALDDLGPELAVRFEDQGPGIEHDELPYLFDPFHRGAGTELRQGFGLGLPTVKTIVEAHGGRVHVESAPGKGSVFTVVLPKAGQGVAPRQEPAPRAGIPGR